MISHFTVGERIWLYSMKVLLVVAGCCWLLGTTRGHASSMPLGTGWANAGLVLQHESTIRSHTHNPQAECSAVAPRRTGIREAQTTMRR